MNINMIYRNKYNRSDIGDMNNNKEKGRGSGMREVSGLYMEVIYGVIGNQDNNGGNEDNGGDRDMGDMNRVKRRISVMDSNMGVVDRQKIKKGYKGKEKVRDKKGEQIGEV